MAGVLDPELKRALAERVRFYNELGIYDFYRREPAVTDRSTMQDAKIHESPSIQPEQREEMTPRSKAVAAVPTVVDESLFGAANSKPESGVTDPVQALRLIREDLGDCTRCRLSKQGRKQIVFGVGNPKAELMFIGEAPGADEDQQGEPFVGRAGQLLNNMIKAMGIRREDVYIANIIKCRPPGNRTPERDECETCSPFLMRQIAAIKPKAIVALGAVAAKTLLAINAPMSEFRGRWFDFRGTKLAVTYHPAFLLRDPRQKKETWKDLQMVMKELGLAIPTKGVE
jgi:uracil-DNA glycosylase